MRRSSLLTIIFTSTGIFLFCFLFDVYYVPSGSMEDTILPGDLILVRSFKHNKQARDKILCFSYPSEKENIMIKRCVGIPGDTLEISDGEVFNNKIRLVQKPTIKQWTRLVFKDQSKCFDFLSTMKIAGFAPSCQNNIISANLSKSQRSELGKSLCFSEISIDTDRPDTAFMTFPKDSLFQWTIDNFGPLVIPAEGMKMPLTPMTRILYKSIMLSENGDDSLTYRDSEARYSFRNNYYFMMGDNRHDSRDSRYRGFVPENLIVGQAVMVMLSFDLEKRGFKRIRFSRIFKHIE